MNLAHVTDATHWFQVLQTSKQTQTALMVLAPGQASEDEPGTHETSEQVLLVLQGEVEAEVADEIATLKRGDIVIVPARTPHRFANKSNHPALTFNVYAPPAYDPNEKG